VFFVGSADTEVSSIIRGACTPDDINDIAEAKKAIMALLRCQFWVELIDSNSSPADGLSRQGLADPLLRQCEGDRGLLVSACESCQLPASTFVFERA